MTQIVIPGADEFGARVNHRTPLALVMAVLRRANPRADYKALRVAAESLRRNGHPAPDGVLGGMSRDRMPDRFDSGADSGAVPSAAVDADTRAPESEVGGDFEPLSDEASAMLRDLTRSPGEAENPRVEPAADSDDDESGRSDGDGPDTMDVDVPEQRKPTRAEVEAWVATQRGMSMSKSGRIPAAILTAYRAAHRDEVLASMVPVEGGAPMPAEVPPTEIH